ncbi:hypothetical protein HPB47_007846 [Ixodes persulcatus]|uniref:Uncharacterized protein n=1 Tax=Ixodes persulcatus TaxID=34615 RepID=A0AC60P6D4_IXOPE|nr:hypothetical protein HPB47_007846 [Ixodes persulcatus]
MAWCQAMAAGGDTDGLPIRDPAYYNRDQFVRGNPFGQRAFVASSQLDNEGPEKQVSLPSCPTGGISANPGRWLDGALLTRRQGHRIASLWVYGDSSADNETQW